MALGSIANVERALTSATRNRDASKDLATAADYAARIDEANIFAEDQTFDGDVITTAALRVQGRTVELLTAADVDAQDNTLTAAQINGGLVIHTSTTGGGTVTTDTAAAIIAGTPPLSSNGETIVCYYINDGDQTLTFEGGTDVTVADTGQTIAANESAVLLFQRTSATEVTLYIVGG